MNQGRRGAFRAWALIVSGAFSASVFAAVATVGPVTLTIPTGFVGAPVQVRGGLRVAAWTKGDATTKTLLQVTVYDPGAQSPAASSEKELAAGADKCLGDFLKGIERRRTHYSQSPIEHLTLAGLPGSRSTWKGHVGDIPAVGVMYCVIVSSRLIVSLHTQDVGTAVSPTMRDAMQAIESMRLAQ